MGYQALIDALLASDLRPGESHALHPVDAAKVGRELGGFWHRLRVPLAGVTGKSRDYVEALERKLDGPLDPYLRRAPLWESATLARLHILELSALHRAQADLMLRRFDVETAHALIERLDVAGRAYWGRHLPELDAWVRYPGRPGWHAGTLVRACHFVLRDQIPMADLTELDATALALLGATVHQVGLTKRCSACFRWSEPGTDTCAEHRPTATGAAGDGGQRAQRIERARKLAEQVYGGWPDACRSTHGRSIGRVHWLSRTLWPSPVDHEDVIVETLMKLVASLPDLLEAMHATPARLEPKTLLLRLERHIDPLEVRPVAWLDAVELANAWQHCETWGRAPRLGGCDLRTKEMIRRALEASSRTGQASRDAVARDLGVHPTLLSHVLRRYSDDLGVRRLAASLRTRRRLQAPAP